MKNFTITLLFFIFTFEAFTQTKHPSDTDQLLRIPVVFHVIHNQVDPENSPYTKDYLQKVLDVSNDYLANTNFTAISPDYRGKARSPKIELYFPQLNNCSDVVNYYQRPGETFGFNVLSSPFNLVKSENKFNPGTLNIVIATIPDTPQSFYSPLHKGVAIDFDFFVQTLENGYVENTSSIQENSAASWVLVHELGHTLGLHHPWGATGPICGDANLVSDVAEQNRPNEAYKSSDYDPVTKIWKRIALNCWSDNFSNYQNFTDYGYGLPYGVSMFTEKQVYKMRSTVFDDYPHWINFSYTESCSPPQNDECSNPIDLFPGDSNTPYTSGSVFNASPEDFPGDPISCDSGQPANFSGNGVWYSFTAMAENNVISVKKVGSQIEPTVSVYQGPNCTNLLLVECNSLVSGATEVEIDFDGFVINQKYYIPVYDKDNSLLTENESLFDIRVTSVIEPDEPDLPGFGFGFRAAPSSDLKDKDSIESLPNLVYPNPLDETSRLSININSQEYIDINLYNISGMPVGNIFSGNLSVGKYDFYILRKKNLPSGIYVLHINQGGKITTQQLIKK